MTNYRIGRAALLGGAALVLAGAPMAASAQPEVESSGDASDEIVVTATRTGETALQRTPLAVSVYSGERLNQTGTGDIADLATISPSINVGAVTASPTIYIRGIGTNNVFNGSDPDVTMQIDGVYLSRPFAQYSDFFDVERIEVLRGPQGTIYGRNAVGGVVNVISRRPSDDLTGAVQIGVGDYDARQAQAFVSGPLIANALNASLALNYEEHDAYDENVADTDGDGVADGLPGVSDANRRGARMQFLFMPTARIEATTRLDYGERDESMQSQDHLLLPIDAPFPIISNDLIGDYHRVSLNRPGTNQTEIWGISEDINFELTDHLSLRSITAYRSSEYALTLDFDATEFDIANLAQSETAEQFSQEFNLVGNYEMVDFVAGLYYLRDHQVSLNEGTGLFPLAPDEVPPPLPTAEFAGLFQQTAPDSEATSRAVFAQGNFHVTDQLSLTLGARYTEDEKDVTQHYEETITFFDGNFDELFSDTETFDAQVNPEFEAFTPKIGLEWQASDDVMLYVSYTEGWKSGGTNFAANSLETLVFQPEEIRSYEIGAKTSWFDNRVRFNVTMFDYDYSDLQVQQAIAQGVLTIANAATAEVRGLELELFARPTSQLELSANATFLHAHYGSFPGAAVAEGLLDQLDGDPRFTPPAPGEEDGTYDASGNRLSNAPDLAYAVSARYTQPLSVGEIYGLVNYRWQDDADFDPTNVAIMREPAYGLVTLGLGYNSPDDAWNAQLLVKNATDEDYFVHRGANGSVPAAISGSPRTVTLSVTRSF